MILYHGCTEPVNTPRIIKAYTGRDFGTGFYTTDIRDQAVKWAHRQAKYRNSTYALLNIYNFDDLASDVLNVKNFNRYTLEWLDFVVSCRHNINFTHEFDLIIGKIANDDVGETIQAVVDGLTSKDFALTKLTFMQANIQICFSTSKALRYLKYLTFERLN